MADEFLPFEDRMHKTLRERYEQLIVNCLYPIFRRTHFEIVSGRHAHAVSTSIMNNQTSTLQNETLNIRSPEKEDAPKPIKDSYIWFLSILYKERTNNLDIRK